MNQGLSASAHLSDEALLAYCDGECGDRELVITAAHLSECPVCRDRVQVLEDTLSEFLSYRAEAMKAAPAPGAFAHFEKQLGSAAARPREARWRGFAARFRTVRFATAAALVVAAFVWFQLASAPAVSASQLLNCAAQAELRNETRVSSPVFHQKVHIRRTTSRSSAAESATVETWTRRVESRLAQRGGGRVWTELEAVYRQNRMAGYRPLAPRGYEAWSKSLAASTQKVSRAETPTGAEALTVTTRADGPANPGALVEASVTVRASDWHPVQQTLRVQGEGEVREYDLFELVYEVVPTGTLEPDILARLMPPPVLPPPTELRPAAETPTPAWDPDRSEIEALYALHRAHACKGEALEVVRAGAVLPIRGVVETDQRKAELVNALRGIPGLKIEIRSAEEHLRSNTAPPPGSAAEVTPRAAPDAPANEPETRLAPDLVDVANRSVSLADDAFVEAWALRRLADAFSSERIERLGPELRSLLDTMVRDHAAALCENLAATRAVLSQFTPAEREGGAPEADRFDWPKGVSELFAAVRQERDGVRELFAGRSRTAFAKTASQCADSIAAAERRSRQLQRDSAVLFQGRGGEKASGLSRK